MAFPPLPGDEPPENLYRMMVGDFEDTWNSVAARRRLARRGNFVFARQAMGLLEFVGRLCSTDPTGGALKRSMCSVEAHRTQVLHATSGTLRLPWVS
jgi:hypothetical protein